MKIEGYFNWYICFFLFVGKILYNYIGGEFYSLYYIMGIFGLYMIILKFLESDIYVKLYIFDSFLLKIYLVLLDDDKVKIKKKSWKGFSVEWNKSFKEMLFDNIIEYYIVVNWKCFFDMFCLFMFYFYGDKCFFWLDIFNFLEEEKRY